MRRWPVRLFTQDVGRKVLALFFALVMFDLLDKKVQVDDRLTVSIDYVDEPTLERAPEAPDRPNVLFIAERGGARPLVLATRPKPDSITLFLHGTRDAIELAKSRRHRFVLRLQKEGPLTPVASDLEGIDVLLEELGPGARVELETVTWEVEAEESRKVILDRTDLALRGVPAPGYDKYKHEAIFQPPEIQLVGPRRDVEAALRDRSWLFEGIAIGGARELTSEVVLHKNFEDVLRMETAAGAELPSIRVSVKFERSVAPIPGKDGLFEVPVAAICIDPDALRAADPKKSWPEWRLEFVKARNGVLKLPLRLLGPDGAALDRAKLALAKSEVALIVRAEAAGAVERTTLPVEISTLRDFPADLDVAFEDGNRRPEVEVRWVPPPPVAPAEPSKSVDGSSEGGPNGRK